MKRTLIILGSVLLLLLFGAGVFFLMPRSKSDAPTTSSTTLPIAGNAGSGAFSTNGGSGAAGGAATTTLPKNSLVEISPGPIVPGESVTDFSLVRASSSPSVKVSYIEQQTGNVFTYLTGQTTRTRVNNKTIPGIQRAFWTPDGSEAFVQYLSGTNKDTVNTYALAATSSKGFFLPQDLTGLAVSARGVLALAPSVNGSAATLYNFAGTPLKTAFTTPLNQFTADFAGSNDYLVYSKPANALSGDAFMVSAAGNFERIAGALNGLTALPSPSGKWALVSYVANGALQTMLVDTSTGTELPLPITTLTDKCVWTSNSVDLYCGVPTSLGSYTYPDAWYQGVAHTSDQIWKIDVAQRVATRVYDLSSSGHGPFDTEAFAIDPNSSFLVFLNKNNGSLWGLSL